MHLTRFGTAIYIYIITEDGLQARVPIESESESIISVTKNNRA